MDTKPFKLKTVVPPLFQAIIRNHEKLSQMRKSTVVSFSDASQLLRQKRDYTRAAEKALSWNADKGSRK